MNLSVLTDNDSGITPLYTSLFAQRAASKNNKKTTTNNIKFAEWQHPAMLHGARFSVLAPVGCYYHLGFECVVGGYQRMTR